MIAHGFSALSPPRHNVHGCEEVLLFLLTSSKDADVWRGNAYEQKVRRRERGLMMGVGERELGAIEKKGSRREAKCV